MARRKQTVSELLAQWGLLDHVYEVIDMVAAMPQPLSVVGKRGEVISVSDNGVRCSKEMLADATVRRITAVSKFGHWSTRKQELALTKLDCSQDKLRDTILHEVAHLLDWTLLRQSGHGETWKLLAVLLGANPSSRNRDEQFEAATKAKAEAHGKIVARCKDPRCDYEVIRMRASRRNWANCYHRKCQYGKGWLVPVR